MAKKTAKKNPSGRPKVAVVKNGPYIVSGGLPLAKEIIVADKKGYPIRWGRGESFPKQEVYSLCRCGHSKNKPYCTGAHAEAGFDGAETASRKRYLSQAQRIKGPKIDLTDAVPLCASGRFCDRGKGTWRLTEESDDPKAKKIAIQQACDCPSGRLVAWNKKTKKAIEPGFKPSVSIVEDPAAKTSGPIWVKGGVPIVSSDGKRYEIRNRVTLCRCGKSGNKPFCDGTHMQIGFSDGDKRIKK